VARAHLFRPITDPQGNLLYNATVTVREVDFAVPIAQTMWSDATSTSDSAVLANPFTAVNGVIDFWLDTPQRVSLLVQSEGIQDILVYLDAPPAPEEIVSSTSSMKIVNAPVTSGQVLLSTGTAGEFQWGNPPTGTGLTPVVVVSSQSFSAGFDPVGWGFSGSSSSHTYDPSTLPPGTNYTYSLHGVLTAASGSLTVTGPSFTLLESGTLAVWFKTTLQAGETVAIKVTSPGPTTTVLGTINSTRDWGFYSYNLAAGTYTPSFVLTGTGTFTGAAHDMWMTGYVSTYGGNVPPHTHAGAGSNSVALGLSSVASGTAATAVGASSQATNTNATAYGYNAHATGNSALAMGINAAATADYSLAVGAGASGSGTSTAWTAVGYNATASGQEAVAVGKNATASADYAAAVGSGASASAASSVAIGQSASAQATSGVAIGQGAVVGSTHNNSVALGSGATTTGSNQIVLGNAGALTIIPGSLQNYGLVSLGQPDTRVGFYGSTGNVQQVVSGSDDGNVTLRTLTSALANMGLIVNNSLQQPGQFANPVGVIDFFYHQDPADGSLGNADFDYRPYTYAPLAFSSNTPYPSGPQWYVGGDHNGYKGFATGLGVLKNMYRPQQTAVSVVSVLTGSTGNKICLAFRHTGQTDSSAATGYIILDQAAGTISMSTKATGALSSAYTVASGNSVNLSSTPYTPFDGNQHGHLISVSGNMVMYADTSQSPMVPTFFYDPALNASGTYVGLDINVTTTKFNSLYFLPMSSWDNFRTTGALTNAPTSEAWWPVTSGVGSSATVSATGNLQLTSVTSGYSIAYIFPTTNSSAKTVRAKYATGTTPTTSMGVVGRYVDPNNYYFVNSSQITRVLSGTQTTLATLSQTFAAGDQIAVTFNSSGLIQVFRNTSLIGSVTDTTATLLASNRYGLGARGAATANFNYILLTDNYNVSVVYK
jgi:hypothetical protein